MAIATKSNYRYFGLFLISIFLLLITEPALAQVPKASQSELNTLWLVIAGSLVFFMNAGFAMLETGLCQVNNSTNVLAKNLIVFCISILAFWLVGFGLMFGNGNSWVGETGFCFQAFTPPLQDDVSGSFDSLEILYPGQPWMVAFFFQLVFAGTAATIVSGAMAQRVKFWAFFGFSFCLVAVAYPLTGRWVWYPNGWLATNFHFLDFAGSTVVHSVGGMAGLVGAILIGPRRGWQGYNPDRVRGNRFTIRPQTFSHYSLSLATLGCLILWLGWLGFNGGSARSLADVPHIIATTMLAGASGGIFVLLLRGLRSRKPPLSSVINGILGGLVSITAASMYVSLAVALVIGAVGSLWIISIEKLLERLKIDDPVGAIPVHLGCGIWGTLAAGLFAHQVPPYINQPVIRIEQIFSQAIGILAVNLTTLVLSLIFWLSIGLAIYALESFNDTLKSAFGRQSSPQSDTDNFDQRLPAGTLVSRRCTGDDLNANNLKKYLNLACQALRVSQQEEARGSDGTFF
ncbi:MAG: ammonium permease [Pleurocapsa sp. MO_226.B13]|nr:ammonium permease [Pleurocapsa sp. MO_226.B13]